MKLETKESLLSSINFTYTSQLPVEQSGVRIFNLDEFEWVPKEVYRDPSVHTVIINRSVSDGSTTTSILRRRQDSTAIRSYVGDDFCFYRTETDLWDYTSRRDFLKHDVEPIIWSDTISVPSCEVDVSTREEVIEGERFSSRYQALLDEYKHLT